jgi:hypothetical protein
LAGHLDHRTSHATLSWDESVTGPVDQIEYTAIYGASALHWHVNRLSGSVTDSGADPGGTAFSCTGTFTPSTTDGGTQGVSLPLDEPGLLAFPVLPTNPDYDVRPPRGLPSSLIADAVSSPGNSDQNCDSMFWNANGNEGWGAAATIGASATLQSTISFASPGLPSPSSTQTPITVTSPPPPYSWLPEDKREARPDLDPALENARNYCTPYALGVGEFGTGVLLLGAPGVGATLTVAGALTAFAAEPFCIATIKRAGDDYRRYRDPPDANFHVLARPAATKPVGLPSCRRWHGAAARFCKLLRPLEQPWSQAAAQVASIDALSSTTNRASAATAAGDATAIAQQSAAGRQLQAQEATALTQQTAAGKALAAALKAQRIRFRLTRAQSAQTIKAVERALAKQGIASSALTPLAGGALTPAAVDLLRALGS